MSVQPAALAGALARSNPSGKILSTDSQDEEKLLTKENRCCIMLALKNIEC